MKRFLGVGAILALVSLLAPSPGAAQYLYFGGGATFPTGDYGDYADTGWLGVAALLVSVGDSGAWWQVEGFFGQNNHNDVEGDKTNPLGAMVGAGMRFHDAGTAGLYAFGQAGLLVHRYSSDTEDSESDTKLGYGLGAGLDFPLSGVLGWVEGRFMGSEYTKFFGIVAGVSIDLKRGDGM